MSLLSAIFLIPLLAALVVLCIPRNYKFVIRLVTLGATLASMVLALALFAKFNDAPVENGFRFNYEKEWVHVDALKLDIGYHVGVDGINLGLIVMGAIVAFAAACVSREIKRLEKEYYLLLLVMTGGILGAFASLNLFFFYFFHELALVPTFIMIGVWGHGENRNYATFNISVYLSLGALIALAGLIALYLQSGANTFDIVALTKAVKAKPLPLAAQSLIFPLLLFGFGILVSLWPFHTWAPLGYGSAPTATAMLHAGVLKKFGLYGLLRVGIPLMPDGATAWLEILAFLCLGNIIFCGFVAMRQKDLNLLIGNSSVAHMGFIFLGIASLTLVGVTGAVVVMVAHGFLAALTFGLSGALREQTGTLEIEKLGGLLRQIPFLGAALVMAMLAGCGLPGFANFVGEAMVLFGSWRAFPLVTTLAAWGALIIGAVYMLRAVRNILHGPAKPEWAALKDANAWVKTPFVLLLAALLLLGVWPRLLTDKIQPSVAGIIAMAETKTADKATRSGEVKKAAGEIKHRAVQPR
ncbi:MAG: NADH-quinone oxidoreductase subunit M [Proteobacteria bacterium]|jgi:NADH-quinone oxidoreductase subunit M|nr:NADH-quinone oxidoreductase subunit M [Pseudomonadota bacterium]